MSDSEDNDTDIDGGDIIIRLSPYQIEKIYDYCIRVFKWTNEYLLEYFINSYNTKFGDVYFPIHATPKYLRSLICEFVAALAIAKPKIDIHIITKDNSTVVEMGKLIVHNLEKIISIRKIERSEIEKDFEDGEIIYFPNNSTRNKSLIMLFPTEIGDEDRKWNNFLICENIDDKKLPKCSKIYPMFIFKSIVNHENDFCFYVN